MHFDGFSGGVAWISPNLRPAMNVIAWGEPMGAGVHPAEVVMDAGVNPGLRWLSKPPDGASCGSLIGFVAHKAERRWARGAVQQTEHIQSARACLGWRGFAPAKGQAGAGRFVA
jgi:hypothetical protein